MKLLIKGGRIIDPASGRDEVGDILVNNGRISSVGGELNAVGAKVFDAAGLVVAPGLIDMHVHLREPGQEAKEDIASGTRAAAAGGFTTVACMANTTPPIDSAIAVCGVQERAAATGSVHVKVIGALTKGQQGTELAEIGDMLEKGAVAISDDGHFVENARIFRAGLEYTAAFDCPVITHAEEPSLSREGYMHEGAVSARLGMAGRPAVSEDIAVARDILLAEYTGARLHIAHVSTKGAVELIREAKARGVLVTAEATPHHLTLTDEAVDGFNTATKVNPPLRSAEHVEALVAGLQDGTIDAIASDHAPHAWEEKDREYKCAPSGFCGLETSLGVILTYLYHTGKLSLMEIINKMSTAPASILGIPAGRLQKGAAADITLIAPDEQWTVDSRKFYTKGRLTPFEGNRLQGRAKAVIVDGRIIMQYS